MAARQALWSEASRNPDLTSLADRLRPPYVMPLPWLHPANAPASRIFEVGYNRLPESYRNLLLASPGTPSVSAGAQEPERWNVAGLYAKPRGENPALWQQAGVPFPMIVAEDPVSGAHELVHALADRYQAVRDVVPKGSYEEVLARMVAGDPYLPHHAPELIEDTKTIHAKLMQMGGKPSPGWLEALAQTLRQLLGRGP